MAYFDSPKNRALWEAELKELRQERELRASGKLKKPAAANAVKDQNSIHRLPVSFEQLRKEEEESLKKPGKKKDHVKEKSVEKNRSKKIEKTAPSLGKERRIK